MFYIGMYGWKWKALVKNKKCWGNVNKPFIDIEITISAQMCYWHRLAHNCCAFSEIQSVSQTFVAMLKVLQCGPHQSQLVSHRWVIWKGYASHLLDAVKYVSLLMMAHLHIYCNCCVDKILVFMSSAFIIFQQNFSFLTIHSLQNMFVLVSCITPPSMSYDYINTLYTKTFPKKFWYLFSFLYWNIFIL